MITAYVLELATEMFYVEFYYYIHQVTGYCVCTFVCVWAHMACVGDQFKPTDFKFDVHVTTDSPDMATYKISEKGAWPEP